MTEFALNTPSYVPLKWTAQDLAALERQPHDRAPVLRDKDIIRVAPDLDVWDAWPLADPAGTPVSWRGGELWFALAAPALPDPEDRHAQARIHHFHRLDDRFTHIGPTFPDGFTPGSREWSGSARLEDGRVTLFFTAAGERGEAAISFRQRLFASTTRLAEGEEDVFASWTSPVELLVPRDEFYISRHDASGVIGEIKAFRDPALHRTPQGAEYLVFTASSAANPGAHNGVVGMGRMEADGTFRALPPLVDASGTNNELERPHIVEHGGMTYVFWSTQAKVFAPEIAAPTGLYGAVAPGMEGPWRLLNGHGLVFANPPQAPFQTYSWWVLPDLSVTSFVDYWGEHGPAQGAMAGAKPVGRQHFGGCFAPFLQLALDGERAGLAQVRA